MALLLRGGHLIDPVNGIDEVMDVLIRDGKVVEVGRDLTLPKGVEKDCSDKYVVPGLVDMHVHLREPGREDKETIVSGTRAAAHGGFTGVCPMPNTTPVCDTGSVVRFILERAASEGCVKVYPIGALSKGLHGEEMAEIGDMIASGAVGFSDDGRGVQDSGLLRRIMDYARQFDTCILSHCEDESLARGGAMNEGSVSSMLGLPGYPAAAEDLAVIRDIAIAELTDTKLHICHCSTARSIEIIRQAKARGVRVTCEVTPHHLFLTDEDITNEYNTNLKMNPPLRTKADAQALLEGILDKTVDAIASDHAPHTRQEKDLEFELAPYGTTGLETSLPLVLSNLVSTGKIEMGRLVELMSINPRKILGIEQVGLTEGSTCDITVIDMDRRITVTEDYFESKAVNSAFLGAQLTGGATDVFVDGYAALEDGKVVGS